MTIESVLQLFIGRIYHELFQAILFERLIAEHVQYANVKAHLLIGYFAVALLGRLVRAQLIVDCLHTPAKESTVERFGQAVARILSVLQIAWPDVRSVFVLKKIQINFNKWYLFFVVDLLLDVETLVVMRIVVKSSRSTHSNSATLKRKMKF